MLGEPEALNAFKVAIPALRRRREFVCMTFCPEPDPKDGLLAALCELGSEARTPAEFVAAIGENLGRSALKVERIFVGLQTNHPEFRARTYVWERSWSDVRTVEWPHDLANRPGYFDSPSQHVHTTRREYRVRVFAEAAKRPCDVCAELHAGGHNDYLMPPGPRLTKLTPIGIRWEEQDGTQI